MHRLSSFSTRPEPVIPFIGQNQTEDREKTIRNVASALAENRLTVAYQTVVTAKNTSLPAFCECLVRIKERDGSITPASRFMPAAEHSDIGRIVDRAVLRTALETLSTCDRVRLSVNLSANGVGDPVWLSILQEACRDDPRCGEFLIVEITETAMLDPSPEKFAFLDALRDLGCSIALDDFGAGHSSISQLSRFRFDFLKIDGSFAHDIETNEDNQFLYYSMVNIARHFDMVTVAEMVDSKEAAETLSDIGIDCLQGYHFGKPELAPGWLDENTGPAAWSL